MPLSNENHKNLMLRNNQNPTIIQVINEAYAEALVAFNKAQHNPEPPKFHDLFAEVLHAKNPRAFNRYKLTLHQFDLSHQAGSDNKHYTFYHRSDSASLPLSDRPAEAITLGTSKNAIIEFEGHNDKPYWHTLKISKKKFDSIAPHIQLTLDRKKGEITRLPIIRASLNLNHLALTKTEKITEHTHAPSLHTAKVAIVQAISHATERYNDQSLIPFTKNSLGTTFGLFSWLRHINKIDQSHVNHCFKTDRSVTKFNEDVNSATCHEALDQTVIKRLTNFPIHGIDAKTNHSFNDYLMDELRQSNESLYLKYLPYVHHFGHSKQPEKTYPVTEIESVNTLFHGFMRELLKNQSFWSRKTHLSLDHAPKGIQEMRAALLATKTNSQHEYVDEHGNRISDEQMFNMLKETCTRHYSTKSFLSVFGLSWNTAKLTRDKRIEKLYQSLMQAQNIESFVKSEGFRNIN